MVTGTESGGREVRKPGWKREQSMPDGTGSSCSLCSWQYNDYGRIIIAQALFNFEARNRPRRNRGTRLNRGGERRMMARLCLPSAPQLLFSMVRTRALKAWQPRRLSRPLTGSSTGQSSKHWRGFRHSSVSRLKALPSTTDQAQARVGA